MATLAGKNKFTLPQLIVFTDVEPVQDEDGYWDIVDSEETQYLILSDHNRSALDITPLRIERRDRMVNAKMRSYHIADKKQLSVSWDMLPSRAYESYGDTPGQMYTADGGAGGADLLEWYKNHEGMFYVLLAYDIFNDADVTVAIDKPESDPVKYTKTASRKYMEMLEVYFGDFSYSVVKRGQTTHDFWNISLSLEEA